MSYGAYYFEIQYFDDHFPGVLLYQISKGIQRVVTGCNCFPQYFHEPQCGPPLFMTRSMTRI